MPASDLRTITPQMRVDELPDEFKIVNNQLWCKWCNRSMNTLRKDNLNGHLYSATHQQNRRKHGVEMSYDPGREKLRKQQNEANSRLSTYLHTVHRLIMLDHVLLRMYVSWNFYFVKNVIPF